MGKLRKVYLPPWMTWLGLIFVVPMWVWITYSVFFSGAAGEDLGLGGWLLSTAVMAVMAVVLVLMGRRKLPAYLIEVEDEEESTTSGSGKERR